MGLGRGQSCRDSFQMPLVLLALQVHDQLVRTGRVHPADRAEEGRLVRLLAAHARYIGRYLQAPGAAMPAIGYAVQSM